MEFWSLSVIPKYLKFATPSKVLFVIFMRAFVLPSSHNVTSAIRDLLQRKHNTFPLKHCLMLFSLHLYVKQKVTLTACLWTMARRCQEEWRWRSRYSKPRSYTEISYYLVRLLFSRNKSLRGAQADWDLVAKRESGTQWGFKQQQPAASQYTELAVRVHNGKMIRYTMNVESKWT
jgi:hypothetical protein